jgi:hypothetical protein
MDIAHDSEQSFENRIITYASLLGQQLLSKDLLCDTLTLLLESEEEEKVELASDVLYLMGALSSLSPSRYIDFVTQEIWSSETRTAFYLQQPFLQRLEDLALTRETLEFVLSSVKIGASPMATASVLLPSFVEFSSTSDDDEFRVLCDLLAELGHDDNAKAHVLDQTLFENLARRVQLGSSNVPSLKRVLDNYEVVNECLWCVGYRCLTLLRDVPTRDLFRAGRDPDVTAALAVVEKFAMCPSWRSRLVPFVSDLASNVLPIEFGALMHLMLCDSSVELVVYLERTSKLSLFVRTVEKYCRIDDKRVETRIPWRLVKGHLLRTWPGRIHELLGTRPHAKRSGSVDDPTCPITLQPFQCPATASDGHTYERDALLKHMCVNGAISPLTKSILDYRVFETRVLSS